MTRVVVTKTCDVCIGEFEGDPRKLYCSDRCKWKAKSRRRGPSCTSCGEQMFAGGSAAAVEPVCHSCRRDRPGYAPRREVSPWVKAPARCLTCGEEFLPSTRQNVYCQQSCRRSGRSCTPGMPIRTRRWQVLRAQVIEEEDTCWLCEQSVDKGLRHPHGMAASADHVVPLSLGGDPFARENVRLAHMSCNQRRYHREHKAQVAALRVSSVA